MGDKASCDTVVDDEHIPFSLEAMTELERKRRHVKNRNKHTGSARPEHIGPH